MEAADDVSYCIADLEDAVEKDMLTIEELYDRLRENWGEGEEKDIFAKTIERAYKERKRLQWRSQDDQFFMNLRVYTVGQMVPHAALRFLDNLPEVYAGSFNQALLEDDSPQNRLLGIFKRVALKHVFNHHEVEQLELQEIASFAACWIFIVRCSKCPIRISVSLSETTRTDAIRLKLGFITSYPANTVWPTAKRLPRWRHYPKTSESSVNITIARV